MDDTKRIGELLGEDGIRRILSGMPPSQEITFRHEGPEGGPAGAEGIFIQTETRRGSREILQSYLVTSALYDFDVYEKRILYNIIKFAQKELSGIRFRDSIRKIDHSLKDYVKVTLPMADFLTPTGSKNHSRIKCALRRLQTDTFTYMDGSTWESLTLIAYPRITYESGISLVSFLVSGRVWDVILNFSKGYSKFYFDVAFSLESSYSMRIYELISSQTHAITYSIANIRKFFDLDRPARGGAGDAGGGKYRNTNDLVRKVIAPAKRELDLKSPVTFTFSTVRAGRKITAITFTPVRQDRLLPADAQFRRDFRRYGCTAIMDERELSILEAAGFDRRGIDNNLDVFTDAKRFLPDFLLAITELKGMSRGKDNPCGWIIEALRGRVRDELETRRKIL